MNLIPFFSELISRLSSKSPKFFVIWQWIFAGLTIITLIPKGLDLIGIHLLGEQAKNLSSVVSAATGALWFMAKMPVKPTVLAVTTDGAVLEKASEQKMPLTVKDQKKQALSNGLIGTSTLSEVVANATQEKTTL